MTTRGMTIGTNPFAKLDTEQKRYIERRIRTSLSDPNLRNAINKLSPEVISELAKMEFLKRYSLHEQPLSNGVDTTAILKALKKLTPEERTAVLHHQPSFYEGPMTQIAEWKQKGIWDGFFKLEGEYSAKAQELETLYGEKYISFAGGFHQSAWVCADIGKFEFIEFFDQNKNVLVPFVSLFKRAESERRVKSHDEWLPGSTQRLTSMVMVGCAIIGMESKELMMQIIESAKRLQNIMPNISNYELALRVDDICQAVGYVLNKKEDAEGRVSYYTENTKKVPELKLYDAVPICARLIEAMTERLITEGPFVHAFGYNDHVEEGVQVKSDVVSQVAMHIEHTIFERTISYISTSSNVGNFVGHLLRMLEKDVPQGTRLTDATLEELKLRGSEMVAIGRHAEINIFIEQYNHALKKIYTLCDGLVAHKGSALEMQMLQSVMVK